jgi:ABC-type molybdate transport system substrate-binding protein
VRKKAQRAITIAAAVLVFSAGLFNFSARPTSAQSQELHVLVSDGMKTVVEELTPQIEQAIGCKLAAEFNSSKNLRDKIQAGAPFDATILTSDVLDDLIKQG